MQGYPRRLAFGALPRAGLGGLAQLYITNFIYISIVLEAPIPNMSLGDKTSLHVISISSDKQQLSHDIG